MVCPSGEPMVLEFAEGMFLGLMRLRGVSLPAWAGFLVLTASLVMIGLSPGRSVAWNLASFGMVAAGGLSLLYPSRKPFDRIASFAGAISYAVYLVQAITIGRFARPGITGLPSVLLTIATGAAIRFVIERPICNFINSQLPAWRLRLSSFFTGKTASPAFDDPPARST